MSKRNYEKPEAVVIDFTAQEKLAVIDDSVNDGNVDTGIGSRGDY